MFEKIVLKSKEVMKQAKNVRINYEVLDSFVEKIDVSEVRYWLSSNVYGILELDIKTLVDFMLLFESIDYSFFGDPKWTITTIEGDKDGSDALLYTLLNYVRDNHTTDFSNITFQEFKAILGGNQDIPLLKERYETIVSVSRIVNETMQGSFYEYVKGITDDRELFKIIIDSFPSFKDVRTHENIGEVPFYKLAQLLVSDILHLREIVEGIDVDYSHLLGCADYKIPQTLRALGIIEYSSELEEIVDNKREIVPNTLYEIEIRASVLTVIAYIKSKRPELATIDINDFLFSYSRKVKDKVKAYHLCRNTNY